MANAYKIARASVEADFAKTRQDYEERIAMLKAKYSYTVEYLPSASTTMW